MLPRQLLVDNGKLRATRNHGNNMPKTASPRTRINQLPGQGFSESFRKLYCKPCAKEISMDKETAVMHCGLGKSRKSGTTSRHEIKLAAWSKKKGEAPGRPSCLVAWEATGFQCFGWCFLVVFVSDDSTDHIVEW